MTQLKKILVGNTFQMFWVNTGITPSLIVGSVITGSETIVSSGTGVSSGNGHYYRNISVTSQGYYVAQWNATIGGLPYVSKTKFRAILGEVD
jgi:hypothetical protein